MISPSEYLCCCYIACGILFQISSSCCEQAFMSRSGLPCLSVIFVKCSVVLGGSSGPCERRIGHVRAIVERISTDEGPLIFLFDDKDSHLQRVNDCWPLPGRHLSADGLVSSSVHDLKRRINLKKSQHPAWWWCEDQRGDFKSFSQGGSARFDD